jgi:hypothetical protein
VAWSRPSNVVAGTQIAAATTNAILADLDLLANASATYGTAATVWTASGTNPVIGNGTFVSTFRRDNKWVDFIVQITMGSTTTYGTGTWTLTLPVTARFSGWGVVGRAVDTSLTSNYDIMGDASTTAIALRCAATTAGASNRVVSSANPFSWGSTDILTVSGRYEAA